MTREREQTGKKSRLRDKNKFKLCLKRNINTHVQKEKNERKRE